MGRTWGYWTSGKLDVLRDYLNAFTTTTKYKSSERIYLDLFAGGLDNSDRITRETLQSSAQIALSIDDPPFTRLRFFEIADKAHDLESALIARHPNRDIKVYPGDCNEQLRHALKRIEASLMGSDLRFRRSELHGSEMEHTRTAGHFSENRQGRTVPSVLTADVQPSATS